MAQAGGPRPQDVAPIVELMESQHEVIDAALEAAEHKSARWLDSTAAIDRDAFADTIEESLPPLNGHLEAEEKNVIPLIDRYLTAEEWAEVGNKGLVNVSRTKVLVLFGMVLHDAFDEHRKVLKRTIPAPVFAVMSRLGPIAYRRYRQKVFPSR